ncbi:sensor histidine kinase [Streptomyces sp. NPDC049687]|uniref:sensor histidine kinase n=1 Tax=Streptomyces sp. NPDC049687 TaxID=3365596 RepID=UPI00378C976C
MVTPLVALLTRARDRALRSAPVSRLRVLARRLTPRRVRVRFAVLFGLLFIASGAVLLGMTYLLVNRPAHSVVTYQVSRDGGARPTIHIGPGPGGDAPPPDAFALDAQLREQAARIHEAQMHDLLVQSGTALAIMAGISVVLSWLLARRVLRPMRTVTAGIRRISARNVHERLGVEGPGDEISDLADSVDGLLDRLEVALESHKRFVANAAHELRTPLTVERALLEESLLDRDATAESFRENFERLLRISTQQSALLESLLTLAVSERGIERSAPVDLAEVTRTVLFTPLPETQRQGLRIVDHTDRTQTAIVPGDAALLERLVANLVHNAAYYNVPDGRVDITVRAAAGRAVLTVSNTGPQVPKDRLEQLFEPFQRLRRTAGDGHHGLGLSIVRAIAAAHDATLAAHARPDGGLEVEVSFPLIVKPAEWEEGWPQTRAATASK